MDTDQEERIRQRAYELWQDEGAPEGRHLDHWEAAAREIGGEAPTIREGLDAGDSAELAAHPESEDAKLEVGLDESFPASDPPAQTAPKTRKRRAATPKSPLADPGSPGGTAGTGGTDRDQDG